MAALTLQDILDDLPKISSKRKYWFFRTEGGDFYEPFLRGRFIAIGYNKISLNEVKAGSTGDATGLQILSSIVAKKYSEEEKRPGHAASQLLKFVYEVRKGDIVMIPSESSFRIAFGEVIETPVYIAEGEALNECPYFKRKKVRWLKVVDRANLDPNLYKLMFSHHTISEGNAYAEYIDVILSSFFVKNDEAHIVLGVQTKKDIKANDLFEMGLLSMQLLDEFCEEEKLQISSDAVKVKIDVRSPGIIELAATDMGAIILVGLIIVGLAGGGYTFKNSKGVDVELKTDGIIEKVRKFIKTRRSNKDKKKLLEDHLKNLDIKDPDDLIKVLKELQDKR